MCAEAMRLKIDDLKKWPSSALRRRSKDYRAMELALIDVGYGIGFHFSLIHWDLLIMEDILEKRRQAK